MPPWIKLDFFFTKLGSGSPNKEWWSESREPRRRGLGYQSLVLWFQSRSLKPGLALGFGNEKNKRIEELQALCSASLGGAVIHKNWETIKSAIHKNMKPSRLLELKQEGSCIRAFLEPAREHKVCKHSPNLSSKRRPGCTCAQQILKAWDICEASPAHWR